MWIDDKGIAPPVDLLQGRVATAGEVPHAIDDVELRWRLDVIMALDDYPA